MVEKYEPDYRQIGKSLEKAFKQNVKGKSRSQQPISSLDNDKMPTLSSEDILNSPILSVATDIIYDEDLLNALAEEQEKYQSVQSIYDHESDHFLDWLC